MFADLRVCAGLSQIGIDDPKRCQDLVSDVEFDEGIYNLYIYKIEAKKVLGNATTHRALVLSS